ncbi:hypothetical protein [Streptomyces sp. NBC_00582]|uniref:hypothetical protein n=1 Tax=Streptomyces sp. NBC_00582 TaxID=2975783 RepID=UPI002E8172D8|nr:hypothetical protein [Streptomyces sp. NBC_00582]WUB64471.1 hypothetical protein OG852_30785 [Streptomyces sp. NBC_00582]
MPSRRVRPRIPETSAAQKAAAQAWNKGMVGQGRPAEERPAFEPCPVDGCATPVVGRRPPVAGMVQVRGSADGAAAHWYCPVRCAAIARARAELRAVPDRQGGER